MLEASSLRSRKQSFSPTELKVNSISNSNYTNGPAATATNNGIARNASSKDKDKPKDKRKPIMTNDSGTSVSEAVVTSDVTSNKDSAVGVLALGHETPSSTPADNGGEDEGEEGEINEDEDTSMKSRSPSTTQVSQQQFRNLAPGRNRSSKLSAEDLNGGLLDGALDDEDEDMDGDTEDTEPAQDTERATTDREADEEEEGEIDEDHEEEEEEEDKPTDTDDDTHLKVPKGLNTHSTTSPAASEDQDDGSNVGDGDGDGDSDVAMTDQEGDEHEDDEDEGTPAGHTEDEGSELPEDDASHAEDGDEDGDGDGDEEEEEEEDDDVPSTPKKDPASFPQKPTLNRPQLIAEDLKDSGDELSDLSEFDDTDDSEDESVGRSGKGKGSSSGAGGSSAAASAASASASGSATNNSRPGIGGRKRSLRETNRENKEQEEKKVKKEIEEDEETNAPQSDKETESEIAEEETNEEKNEGEEEGEEEEDLEKKLVYTEALEALSSIEVEFAHLRDKMYEERMLELETEVEMINDGTHPELSTLMKEIEDKREQRLRIARAWRTHLNEISQAEFEIKEYQAHCTYQSKKRELRMDMINGVGRKQQQLRLELTLAESRARYQPPEKSVLMRARKYRRAVASDLRAINDRHGFPVSTDLRMIGASELDEDFAAMGIPRPVPQTNTSIEYGQGHGHSHSQGHGQTVPQSRMYDRPMEYGPPPPSVPMSSNMTSYRPSNTHRWGTSIDHPSAGMRPEVEIYEDGSRCKVDGIWYKPNDLVVVLDAALGQYHAKYLFLANDEIMLQKTDGTKTRLHLNLFRGRKLCMQPRP
ncbi:hypothetical protein FBU30_004702 [Linnemannia zychae]|nr:hypothetical protein FBU30_004702 [Linnemannia zychae]